MTGPAGVELFMENAAKVAAQVFRAAGEEELNSIVWQILDGEGSNAVTIYCPGATEKEKAVKIPPARLADDYVNASVCVEEVFGAVAETGSLICISRGGRAVQAGLLPSHHLAIVSAERVYETLDDFFAQLGTDLPTNITFETGPSRTADIELTLTIGVHGPERLTIVVV
jgi:L-lactate dehydrogenase complex protein LldG